MLPITVHVKHSGVEITVRLSPDLVTQSVIKAVDVTDIPSAIVPFVPPTLTVKRMENATATSTGADQTVPSTQVNAIHFVKNVTAPRPVTALSALLTPFVIQKVPATVSTIGLEQTAQHTTKAVVTPNVQMLDALDHWPVAVMHVLYTHTETNITKTVSVTTTGDMMTVLCTLETVQFSALAVLDPKILTVAAVSLATTTKEDSSENPKWLKAYVSANNGGQDTTVQLGLESVTSSVMDAGDQTLTNATVV